MAWLLILTLTGANTAEIHHIEGFASESSCNTAGQEWKSGYTSNTLYAIYACVER